ncbi:hypothetical protein FRC17_004695, partial [Serendipita sp. 399]
MTFVAEPVGKLLGRFNIQSGRPSLIPSIFTKEKTAYSLSQGRCLSLFLFGLLHCAYFLFSAFSPTYYGVLIAFFIGGLGKSIQIAQINVFWTSNPRVNGISLLHGTYGIGAFVSPLICQVMKARGFPWRGFFWVSLGLALFNVTFGLYAFKTTEEEFAIEKALALASETLSQTVQNQTDLETGRPDSKSKGKAGMGEIIRMPYVWTIAAFLGFYQGSETIAQGFIAIRKKIESELARKRTISTTGPKTSKKGKTGAKGTVAALKPSQALTVPDNITVADASQLCAAKRTDCVLVVDEEEGLSGIFTAKDLAFRVTAEGLDPRTTLVSTIMTKNPMVTRDTTSATEALQLMVQRGFRHLPVCNEDGNVVGLLDITKVFHEALEKVERGSSASQKLYSAFESVQTELGGGVAANPQAAAMMSYIESLRDKTALPDLTTVMDARTQPATVGPRTTVRDAAKLMKENRTTAVCVMEGGTNTAGQPTGAPARIAGIFTSKDVVLRVIAAGLDPGRCSV